MRGGDACDRTPAVLKRLGPATCAVALVLMACGQPGIDVQAQGGDEGFVPVVVDVEGLSGAGVSMTTDADGNPHLSYLALPEEEGEEAAPPDPLAPTLPAVVHAHLVDNVWTRDPVADEQEVTEDDETAIAVDADGIHHVAWTAGGQVLYSTNAEGEFLEEPEVVTDADAAGVSIAADEQGTPMVAFVEVLTEPEGPDALVRVATRGAEGWEVETAAESVPDEPISTGIGAGGGAVFVAFGSAGESLVAIPRGNRWFSETADPDGGAGVSLALDADGVPHVSYSSSGGAVREAHQAADGWEVSDVGQGATDSATSIAVDDAGVHHIVWQTAEGIAYAANPEGEFAEQELPPTVEGGVQPTVGARVEGSVYVAWYDQTNGELQMAILSDTEPLLAVPSPTAAPPGGGDGAAACEPEGDVLTIAAPPGALTDGFDKDCLAVEAGQPYTIEFDNQDPGQIHNVNVYPDESSMEALLQPPFEGDITGPDSIAYEGDPIEEPGDLFFKCDFHSTSMTGTFVVAEAGGGGGGGGGS
jgi:hypothetical protein